MNTYDRIINILLESRIEDYLDRLDEAKSDAGLSIKDKQRYRGLRSPTPSHEYNPYITSDANRVARHRRQQTAARAAKTKRRLDREQQAELARLLQPKK